MEEGSNGQVKLYPSLDGIADNAEPPAGNAGKASSDGLEIEAIDRCKTIEDVIEALKKEGQLWKVRSFDKWHRRNYKLDTELLRICFDTFKLPCLQKDPFIDLADVVDIRKGWKTDVFNKVGAKVEKRTRKTRGTPILEEKNCFSIIYGSNKRTLDLVAPNEETCDNWVKGVGHLISVIKSLEQEKNYERWLRRQFVEADKDKTGNLNFAECKKLLKQLNINMHDKHARRAFEEANTNKREANDEQVLDENEFVTFYFSLQKRPEVEELYKKYSSPSKAMGATELCSFMQKEQNMTSINTEDCRALINTFEHSDLKKNSQMSLAGFTNLLLSEKFEIFNSEHRVVYQDMSRPLSHYFIASSHNTYLTGNQLHGKSSIEAYIDVLKQGCRCVELDCWDGDHGEPVIYHGYTLTSKILFKEVLQDGILPVAFETSEFPVILSLENHCSEEQQTVMVKHLKDILGDKLYTVQPTEDMTQLPSPDDLKGKIIVKAKKARAEQLVTIQDEVDAQSESESEEDVTVPPGQVDFIDAENQAKRKAKVSSIWADLVNICQAVHFPGFQKAKEDAKFYQMSSFSEKKAEQMIEENGEDFVELNRNQLCRIYPAGSRTNSSNYKPIPFWNAGCQIVALNYQTDDKRTTVNRARFLQNGSCGYVLKPDILLNDNEYHPTRTLNRSIQKIMTVRVISGQHLPKHDMQTEGDIVDPYVLVKIQGHPDDKQKFRTSHVRNNGFNPVWNKTFKIPVKVPELAFLMFKVKDHSLTGKNALIGVSVLPLMSVKEGYRHVYLTDFAGNFLTPASLFVHITIEDV